MSETLSGVYKFELVRYICIYVWRYVSLNWRVSVARYYQECTNSSWCVIYIYIFTSHVLSTNGERAGLANSKLTIDSLMECS